MAAIGDTSAQASHSASEMHALAQRLQADAGALSRQVGDFLAEIRQG